MATTAEEIHTIVEHLSPAYQQKVLKLAQDLARMQAFVDSLPEAELPPGTPGKALRHIELPLEVAKEMERAIEEDCERIDPDEPPMMTARVITTIYDPCSLPLAASRYWNERSDVPYRI